MAHVVADRPPAERQAAKDRGRPVKGPVNHSPGHLWDAGEAALKFDKVQLSAGDFVELQRTAQRHSHARRTIVAVAVEDLGRLVRRRTSTHIYQPVFRDSPGAS